MTDAAASAAMLFCYPPRSRSMRRSDSTTPSSSDASTCATSSGSDRPACARRPSSLARGLGRRPTRSILATRPRRACSSQRAKPISMAGSAACKSSSARQRMRASRWASSTWSVRAACPRSRATHAPCLPPTAGPPSTAPRGARVRACRPHPQRACSRPNLDRRSRPNLGRPSRSNRAARTSHPSRGACLLPSGAMTSIRTSTSRPRSSCKTWCSSSAMARMSRCTTWA